MDNKELIKGWALRQVGCPYVYGGTGARCTPEYRQERAKQYPAQAAIISQYCLVLRGDQEGCAGCRYAGKPCYDCAQLVKSALELVGQRLPSGATSQWRSASWAWKGPIDGKAAQQVCLLFRQGESDPPNTMAHVGLSLGDGSTVDARGHKAGVVLSKMGDYPWTHYAVPYGLAELAPPLKQGDTGERVRLLQSLLMQRGYPLPKYGADGSFGQETYDALQCYLKDRQLAQGDTVDATLMARLQKADELAPVATVELRLSALEVALYRIEKVLKGDKA